MTTTTKKAANWEARANKWGEGVIQKAVDARVALQDPYIQAGTSAFGLVGSSPVETTQDVQKAQQLANQQRQGYIDQGINPNLSPVQQEAMRQYLGQMTPYDMGDYQTQAQNLRAERDMRDKGYTGMMELGLGGVGAATGARLQGAQYLGQSAMNTQDAYTQAKLLNQQAKMKERSGLMGLGGVLVNAGISAYQNRTPETKSNYNTSNMDAIYGNQSFDTPYQINPYGLGAKY